MRALSLILVLCALAAQALDAQSVKLLPKVLAKDVSIHPFTGNASDRKIDPKTKGVFDELRVTVTSTSQTRIRISGKMEKESGSLEGRPVLHLGKLALVAITERSGFLNVGVSSVVDATKYYVVFEVEDQKLSTKAITLDKDVNYTWAIVKKDGKFEFKIFLGDKVKETISAPENQVKSFGVAAVCRWAGNQADINLKID